MWRYYLLLTDVSETDIDRLKQQVADGAVHPKQAKSTLARRITADFHGEQDAARAAEAFDARFSRGELAHDELEEIRITVSDGSISLAKLVAEAGLAASSSEATRKIQQGGVKVDRERVTDIKTRILASQGTITLEVGRRAVRVVLG